MRLLNLCAVLVLSTFVVGCGSAEEPEAEQGGDDAKGKLARVKNGMSLGEVMMIMGEELGKEI